MHLLYLTFWDGENFPDIDCLGLFLVKCTSETEYRKLSWWAVPAKTSIAVDINGLNSLNVYKPPLTALKRNPLITLSLLSEMIIVIITYGTAIKITMENYFSKGLRLILQLIFSGKDKRTFKSRRWPRGYNPDLCFVTNPNTFSRIQTALEN